MIFKSDFKALKTIKKDWEMNGKTGVSRKTQMLVDSFGDFSALTVKTSKDVEELNSGEDYTGVFELSEGFDKKGFELELLKVE